MQRIVKARCAGCECSSENDLIGTVTCGPGVRIAVLVGRTQDHAPGLVLAEPEHDVG